MSGTEQQKTETSRADDICCLAPVSEPKAISRRRNHIRNRHYWSFWLLNMLMNIIRSTRMLQDALYKMSLIEYLLKNIEEQKGNRRFKY